MKQRRRPSTGTSRARSLRRDMTDVERLLWSRLSHRKLGIKWRRQEPIGRYIVDFVAYWPAVIVELDGSQHIDNDYDQKRDAWLRDQGFKVLRFWNEEVLDNLEEVLVTITEVVAGIRSDWRDHRY